ncbi:MAG: RNA polymerase sigma factor [Spirochaetota bacterium]
MRGSTEQTDERVLIERARDGDRDAFSFLVRRYLDRIYRVAYSVVHNADDASDVAQETFVRAYRNLARFDPARPLFPWLYQIARNLGINRIQRIRKRETGLPEYELVGRERGPAETAVRMDEATRVRAAVEMLPEQHRIVIELNHFQECSYKEMAELLNIPIGTVMSRLYHARKRLRTILEEELDYVDT